MEVFTNTRKDHCKGFRRGPKFELWMWCNVILCFISFPCIFSKCQGVDISVTLYPEGMIYLRYGQPLEIFCLTERDTADDLQFFIAGERIESERYNSTARRVFFEHLEKGVHIYYCKNNVINKQCNSRVLVDLPPSNVTDFSCLLKNIEEMSCSWSYNTKIYSKINPSLTFLVQNITSKPCIATKKGKTWSCVWNITSHPRYKLMQDHYYFQLKSCNVFGCNEQSFTINHCAIVKPDPPTNLKVVSNNPHSVLLQWDIPNNIADFLPCPVVHRIEYQIAKIDKFHSVDATHLPPKNKTNRFLLSNLPYAHMSYEVRIYIKPALAAEDKFWSNFTYNLFPTASERPQRPPETIVGAFNQAIFDDKRVIYVYWKQLEENEEAGANFTYKIVTKQGNKNPQTLLPDKKKSSSYVILNDTSFEAIDVSIWSTNAIGSSINSTHLYIPPIHDTEALTVSSFTTLDYENGTYKISWVALDNVNNYTLFWCQRKSAQICSGRINFTVLDPNKNTYVIDLPEGNRYQFAISANNKSKTSGMIWASCDISEDSIPMYGYSVKLDQIVRMHFNAKRLALKM